MDLGRAWRHEPQGLKLEKKAPAAGFEPATCRLTVGRSAVELRGIADTILTNFLGLCPSDGASNGSLARIPRVDWQIPWQKKEIQWEKFVMGTARLNEPEAMEA